MTNVVFLSVGDNKYGQLGRSGDETIPSPIEGLTTEDLYKISVGPKCNVAIYPDKTCAWGFNSAGMLFVSEFYVRCPTEMYIHLIDVKIGNNYINFLDEMGQLFTTTRNQCDLLEFSAEQIQIPIKQPCIAIFMNDWILLEDGSICTFRPPKGNLEKYEISQSAKSKEIKSITSFGFSKYWAILLTAAGEAFGLPHDRKSKIFIEIDELKNKNIVKISGNYHYLIALTATGEIYVYGGKHSCLLKFDNTKGQYNGFVELPKFTNSKIIDVSTGEQFSVFVDAEGNVWTTGDYDQTHHHERSFSPKKVDSVQNAVAVSCGNDFTLIQVGGTSLFDDAPIMI